MLKEKLNFNLNKSNLWKSEDYINKKFLKNIFILVVNYLNFKLNNICNIEISVILTDNKHIKSLNNTYRNIDKETNVLTFALYQNILDIKKDIEKLPYISLGDIFFSFEKIQTEAIEQQKLFKNHLIHLLIHSYLHLFGFDHIKSKERKQMEKMEINILNKLNINNPYIIDNIL